MAITEVASQRAATSFGAGDSGTLAFPNNVTEGNLLIVAGNSWQSGGAPTSIVVTDTRSTVYSVLSATANLDGGVNHRIWIAYGVALSSGACTVTVNPQGSASDTFISLDEFTGQAAEGPLDINGGSSTGSSTTPADSITTSVANALIIGSATAFAFPPTITKGASWTEIGQDNDGPETGASEFGIVTTATAYSVDWSWTPTSPWVVYTASFAPPRAPGAPGTGFGESIGYSSW